MRLPIISILLALAIIVPQALHAQVAASNPLEWMALAEGNDLINGQRMEESRLRGRQDGTAAEYDSGRVQPHPPVGKTVQQLSENRKRLCIVAESLYPSVQRRRADFSTLGKTWQGRS